MPKPYPDGLDLARVFIPQPQVKPPPARALSRRTADANLDGQNYWLVQAVRLARAPLGEGNKP